MAFDLRCPECKAKLRFEEIPKRGETIACTKCDHEFRAPGRDSFTAIVEDAKEEKKPEEPKKKKQPKQIITKEREHFNPILLLAIVGGAMLFLILALFVPWAVFIATAAQTENIVATVPIEYNVIRGVNIKAMKNVPNVKSQQDKIYDATALGVFSAIATKAGLDKDADLSYYICAKRGGKPGLPIMYFLMKDGKSGALGDAENTVMRSSNTRFVAVQLTGRLIAACVDEYPNQPYDFAAAAKQVLAKVKENQGSRPTDGTADRIGVMGKIALRGQVWSIIVLNGDLKDYLGASAAVIKEDSNMSGLISGCEKAKVLCTWTSYGSAGIRFGAGLEMPTADDARSLKESMKNGPLGKGDESEVPNKTKQAISFLNPKEAGEFFQFLEYKSVGPAAYLTSQMGNLGKANQGLELFNNSMRGSGVSPLGGGGGGFGPPGGGRGG